MLSKTLDLMENLFTDVNISNIGWPFSMMYCTQTHSLKHSSMFGHSTAESLIKNIEFLIAPIEAFHDKHEHFS